MKNWDIKKHSVLVTSLVSSMIIIIFLISMFISGQERSITLTDLQGNRTIIKDIKLMGEISTRNYEIEYIFDKGKYRQKNKTSNLEEGSDRYSDLSCNKIRRLENLLGFDVELKVDLYYKPSHKENIIILDEKRQQCDKETCVAMGGNYFYIESKEPITNLEVFGKTTELDVYFYIYGRDKGGREYFRDGAHILSPTEIKLEKKGEPIFFLESYLIDSEENKLLYDQYYDVLVDEESKERSYTVAQESGLTCIGDELYFTPIVDRNYYGKSYIYVLDIVFGYANSHVQYKDSKFLDLLCEKGKVRPIYEIDLNKEDIEVVCLESLKEQLILVLRIGNQLCIRRITKEGELLDEKYTDIPDEYIIYDYVALCEEDSLTLGIVSHKGNLNDEAYLTLVGMEINEKGQLNVLKSQAVSYDEIGELIYMKALDNRLYVIEARYDQEYGYRIYLTVYEGEQIVYQGRMSMAQKGIQMNRYDFEGFKIEKE